LSGEGRNKEGKKREKKKKEIKRRKRGRRGRAVALKKKKGYTEKMGESEET